MKDEADFVEIPQLAHSRFRREIADVAVGVLRIGKNSGNLALALDDFRKPSVLGEIRSTVEKLAESDESARRRLLAERTEEVLLQVYLHQVVRRCERNAPSERAFELDSLHRH